MLFHSFHNQQRRLKNRILFPTLHNGLTDALSHVSSLVRSEVDLARSEINENLKSAGVVFAIIAFVMIKKGMSDLELSSLAPTRIAKNVKRDAQAVKGVYDER